MKIFVIYAEAGSGHKKIAEAIYEKLCTDLNNASLSIIDILKFTPSIFQNIYSRGYIFLISKFGWVWAVMFNLAETKKLSFFNVYLRKLINRIFCKKFLKFIIQENPDLIISTHFLINELVSFLKKKGLIKTKLISVVTDYGVHKFWIADCVDLYIAGCSTTKEILITKGVAEEKIEVWGIPVRQQFLRPLDKSEIRNSLDIQNDEFVSLIVTGGIGIGPFEEIIRYLDDRITVLVICGRNYKLYKELQKLNYKKVKLFGWVNNIAELMISSDVIVTKGGGSTIAECLALNLPMIFFSLIPGQEVENARIMKQCGAGIILKNPKDIAEQIFLLRDLPDHLEKMRNSISQIKKDNFFENLLKLINEKEFFNS